MEINSRTDIINFYLSKYNRPTFYLEIGINQNENFNKVKADNKFGVDPSPKVICSHNVTSDEFFSKNSIKFDVIFIDGLHIDEQVYRDIENSLNFLNDDGVIVLHDINPTEEYQQLEQKNDRDWRGTAWKAFAKFRLSRDDLEMFTIDIDAGCGIIKLNKSQHLFESTENVFNYKALCKYRKDLLNLISVEEFKKREYIDSIITIFTVATNKYVDFIPTLYKSISKYFLPNHNINVVLYTNNINIFKSFGFKNKRINFIIKEIEHKSWPFMTLLRYNFMQEMLTHKDIKKSSHLFYIDTDMEIVSVIDEQILGDGLTSVLHPGLWKSDRKDLPYENRNTSTAYVPIGTGETYFQGNFQGGSFESYNKAINSMAENINIDLKNNVIAIFHDESHWNRYLLDNKPSNLLNPGFAYPNGWDLPFAKKIIHLDKNNNEIRR